MTNETDKPTAEPDTMRPALPLSARIFNKLKSSLDETLMAVVAGGAVAWFFISGIDHNPPGIGAAIPAPDTMALHSGIGDQSCSGGVDKNGNRLSCLMKPVENMCTTGSGELCDDDMEIARIAWKYFENNYNPETGLVNAVNNYPSTTMWDTGSALAAHIAALDFKIISQKEFDDSTMALLETLSSMVLFDDAAPNKVYNTKTRKMVDYANKERPLGIGVSVLDLARLMSWLNTLQCMHPKYYSQVNSVLSRWDYQRLVSNEELYGMARDRDDETIIHPRQEGRLGYEQYAGKIFDNAGFSVETARSYSNQYRSETTILGIDIAYDSRDPREFFANNYVVTESYALDAIESGIDDDNRQLLENIYLVQKKRWEKTGIVTAISEDNIDRKPYFLYNSIYNAGLKFNTTNSSGENYDHLKSISTKAAISMALLFPDDPYSKILMDSISSAYDAEGGWYSGVYESGGGYNDVTTANTNGVIMSGLLYKKYGAFLKHCDSCAKPLAIKSDLLKKQRLLNQARSDVANTQRISECEICEIKTSAALDNQ